MATPIGNLADISLRALHVLQKVDVIACEDTRHTQQMLRAYGIDRPGSQLLAVHQHNEAEAAQTVITRLAQGERVAYVSDAGTPASRAVVLLEAPHRIEALAQALGVLGERRITVGRELTKQFEQIETVAAQDLAAWLAEKPERQRGEFALVVHDAPVAETSGEGLRVLQLLLPELPLKTAVKLAAEITGESKNVLYDQALALKNA